MEITRKSCSDAYRVSFALLRLYFANKDPEVGLTVVDVRSPTHPQVVNTLPLPAPGGYMTLQDGFLHFGASEAGYLKIAVKKLHQLQIVGNYQFPMTDPDIDHILVAGHLAIASGDNPGNGTRLILHARFPDTTGPQVSMVFPPPGSTNVPLSTRIGMTFTDQIDILTANHKTFIVRPLGGEPLAGTVSGTQDVLNFTPDTPLLPNRTYQVRILADGLKDYAGNPVATFTALFSTGDRVDQGIACTLPPPGISHVGTTATFVATDCFGPESAFSYAWDFGDGTPPTAFASHAEVSHTYTMPGHYVVTLTISNGVGQSTLALPHTVIYPPTVLQATHSSSIVYDALRQRVWNVNPDNDTITAIDAQSLNKIVEVPVGQEPTTLALDAEGNIWISHAKDDNVMVLDGQGKFLDTIPLPFASHPYGLAFDAARTTAYVTLEATGQLASVDPRTRMLRSVTPVGPWVRHLAITGDGQRAFLGRFIAPQDHGEVYEVELIGGQPHLARIIPLQADLGPDSESGSRGIPNYLGALAISPDGRQVWIPSKKDNTPRGLWRDGLPLTFETTVRAIVSQITVASSVEDFTARRDLDDRSLPSAVVFSQFGDYAFVTTLTSNTVEILDAYTGETYAGIDNVGLAPRGLALDPTANRLFIHNFLSRTVAVYDISALGQSNDFSRVAEIAVVEHEKLPPQVLYGKQIFYNASDPRMSADQYLSCAACHLDGESDGRVWDFTDRGEGLRNTPSLQGRQGEAHGLLHWSANFDEIQDFENDIRTAFSGIGFLSDHDFTTGTRARPLGDPKEGLSAALDALAAYVRSLRDVPPSPLARPDDRLSPAALRGQALFFSSLTGCAACHAQPEFTDSELTFSPPLVHDVGTLTAASGSRLGASLPGIDTPTLRGVWQTAPYLHDGSVPTLLDVLTTSNPNDRHGVTSGLTESQLKDLITFLQELR